MAKSMYPGYENVVIKVLEFVREGFSTSAFSPVAIILAILIFVVGFLFYSVLAGMAGSLVSKPEDTAQMQLDTSSLDKFLTNLHNNTFAISGMLFQDACNLDLERLRRCYILETDSRYHMVPFCAYNLTSLKGRTLYR